MKKIASLILIPLLLIMGTVSVSAKNHSDSHYDFYVKAGPTTIEKVYTEKMQTAEAMNLVIPVFEDVGIWFVKAVTTENVKAASLQVSSQYAELTGNIYLRRPVIQYASAWNSFYRSDITKRHKAVIRPPDQIILIT